MVKEGTDDNQDRIPFYDQAVSGMRCGPTFIQRAAMSMQKPATRFVEALESIWRDIVTRKCMSRAQVLYDGVPAASKIMNPFNWCIRRMAGLINCQI